LVSKESIALQVVVKEFMVFIEKARD